MPAHEFWPPAIHVALRCELKGRVSQTALALQQKTTVASLANCQLVLSLATPGVTGACEALDPDAGECDIQFDR